VCFLARRWRSRTPGGGSAATGTADYKESLTLGDCWTCRAHGSACALRWPIPVAALRQSACRWRGSDSPTTMSISWTDAVGDRVHYVAGGPERNTPNHQVEASDMRRLPVRRAHATACTVMADPVTALHVAIVPFIWLVLVVPASGLVVC
jgi:hypothetical protein